MNLSDSIAVVIPRIFDEYSSERLCSEYVYLGQLKRKSDLCYVDIGLCNQKSPNQTPKNRGHGIDFYSYVSSDGSFRNFSSNRRSSAKDTSICSSERLYRRNKGKCTFLPSRQHMRSAGLELSDALCRKSQLPATSEETLLPGLVELPFYNPLRKFKRKCSEFRDAMSVLKPAFASVGLPPTGKSPSVISVEIIRPSSQHPDQLYRMWLSQQTSHRSLKSTLLNFTNCASKVPAL
ncbi:hypothetical protein MDAP_002657 [Mitosporidium daphniae]|uniref:Uncharacterized protein n=1 Tax=Mitosporidium daphniae TaxID=1485682 RepID=A0A098VP70_9MICR|nr:uncharacterized protein DI09_62p80 [Mitosporidium daphniae]KGG50604.1 hypothetical protein DI09_62p80 [Mitosporidium daphniae]|eukprot:XP_013237048.1 uncharacterized protein DI09_62p80 [Mitosporidium daphniae]